MEGVKRNKCKTSSGDEGRSLGAERQAQAPNSGKLRVPKVQVVSVSVKGTVKRVMWGLERRARVNL
jgi:hypothetical protein